MPIIQSPPAYDYRGAFETIPRQQFNSGSAITNTRRYLAYFTALQALPLTQLGTFTGSTAPSAITAARLGLYTVAANGDCTMVAQTANDATIGIALNTEYLRPLDATGGFPTSYTLIKGQRYAASMFITGTTLPSIMSQNPNVITSALSPRISGYDSSAGTDLAATITAANIANIALYLYLTGLP